MEIKGEKKLKGMVSQCWRWLGKCLCCLLKNKTKIPMRQGF